MVERGKRPAYGARPRRVERVVLAGEVAGAAQPSDLGEDVAAAGVGPLTAELDEFLAAEVVARLPRPSGEVPLDHHLRRDAGVVDTGDPEDRASLHPPPAGEDVFQRPP